MIRLRPLGVLQQTGPTKAAAPSAPALDETHTGIPQIDAFIASPIAKVITIGTLCGAMAKAFPGKWLPAAAAGAAATAIFGIVKVD